MNWNLTFVALLHWKIFIDVKPTVLCSWGNRAGCQHAKSTCKYGPLPLRRLEATLINGRQLQRMKQWQPVWEAACLVEDQLVWALWERLRCGETDFYNEKEKGFTSSDLFSLPPPSSPNHSIAPCTRTSNQIRATWLQTHLDVRTTQIKSLKHVLSKNDSGASKCWRCFFFCASLFVGLIQIQRKRYQTWGGVVSCCP